MNDPGKPPSEIVGKNVRLRTFDEPDYRWLFDLATSPEMLARWRFRGAAPRPEEFAATIWTGVHTQMIIETLEHEPIGLVTSYAADPRSGHTKVALLMAPDAQRRGWPLEGALLFFDHLFRHWPIRKVYVEGPEPIMVSIGLGRSLATTFRLEGRLAAHELFDGDHQDLLIYGVTKEDSYRRFETALARRRAG